MASAASAMGGPPNVCHPFSKATCVHLKRGKSEITQGNLQSQGRPSKPCGLLHQPCCTGYAENGGLAAVGSSIERRKLLLLSSVGFLAGVIPVVMKKEVAVASEFADMPALRGKDYGKSKMRYPDYTETPSGLQYKDLRVGEGPTPKTGEMVVVDWDGYTIGYLGRIFEARNKAKGGPFEGEDKEFFKFRVGSQEVIPAFEEAIVGMAPGGVRRACVSLSPLQQCRIIVPPELGYPDNDFNRLGPRPTTFSGQRALDFVLRNQGLIDKTLLFDIELLKIIPGNAGVNSF